MIRLFDHPTHFFVLLRSVKWVPGFSRTAKWMKIYLKMDEAVGLFCKKGVLKNIANSQENTCVRVSSLIKLAHAKFLRTPFLQNTSASKHGKHLPGWRKPHQKSHMTLQTCVHARSRNKLKIYLNCHNTVTKHGKVFLYSEDQYFLREEKAGVQQRLDF